jgi:hypothetical protein
MGLFNELYYPRQNFWGQLLIPFTWKQWKARQIAAAAGRQPASPQAAAVDSEGSKLAV